MTKNITVRPTTDLKHLLMIRQYYKRAILLLCCTHTGSKYALFPPEWKIDEGNVITANKGQLEIYEWFKHVMEEVADFWNIDSIWHAGDAIDGTQPKNFAEPLCLPGIDQQKQCFEALIKPYLMRKGKRRQFAAISGTGYHDSIDSNTTKDICTDLGGKYLGVARNFRISGTSRMVNMIHEINSSIYMAGALDKQGLMITMAEAMNKLPKVDIVIRGHLHSFMHIHSTSKHLVLVPGWKAFEPYKQALKSYGKMQPDIGAVVLLVDDYDRISVHHYTMDKNPHILDSVMVV